MKIFAFILSMFVFIIPSTTIAAQDSSSECNPAQVIEYIHQWEAFAQQFDEADLNLSNNLTDVRRIPRVDLLVNIQNIRREFEWLQPPSCVIDLHHLTSMYWSQRIDMLTLSLASNQRRNSLEDTADFYQTIILPAIYRLEGAANIDFFSELGKDRPEDSPMPTNIEIGETIINNTSLEKVIAVETVTLPNCNGSSELVISREFSKSSERHAVLHLEGQADAALGVAQLHVEALHSVDDQSSMSESLQVEMRAAPGTTVTYEIEWIEVSTSGVLEIMENQALRFVEFSVPEILRANVRQPIQTPCEADEEAPTPTPHASD